MPNASNFSRGYVKTGVTRALFTKWDIEVVARPLMLALRRTSQEVLGGDGFQAVAVTRVDRDQHGAPTIQEAVVTESGDASGLVFTEGAWATWEETGCCLYFDRLAQNQTVQWVDNFDHTFREVFGHRDTWTIGAYFVLPITDAHGVVIGTLCGGSREVHAVNDHLLFVARKYCEVLSAAISRETLLRVLEGSPTHKEHVMTNPDSLVPPEPTGKR